MKKTKKEQSRKKPLTMLHQAVGSMEDQKTNEDFNNQHPDHDSNGLKKDNSGGDNIKIRKKSQL